jgi:hypothetical protein
MSITDAVIRAKAWARRKSHRVEKKVAAAGLDGCPMNAEGEEK